MLRTCNGDDPTIMDPTGMTGSCGRVFDDVEQHVICPHDTRRASRPLDPTDSALRAYTLVPGRAGDFYVQCEPCAFNRNELAVNAVIHWCQVRTLAEADKWARWHDEAAGHRAFPATSAPALTAHHHHPLTAEPCDRVHADYPETARHAYAVLTLYGTHTYQAKVFADLAPAQLEVERTYGILVAMPIIVDLRHHEPEPLPAIVPDIPAEERNGVEQLAAAGRATVAEHLSSSASAAGGPDGVSGSNPVAAAEPDTQLYADWQASGGWSDAVDGLREEYQQLELDHDRNPTEAGFVEWLVRRAHRLADERDQLAELTPAPLVRPYTGPNRAHVDPEYSGKVFTAEQLPPGAIPFSPFEALVPRQPGDTGPTAAEEIEARVRAAQLAVNGPEWVAEHNPERRPA